MPMASGPDGVLYNVPTGGGLLSGLDPDYQAQQLQLKQAQAFKGGVPTDDAGNPDYSAMANKLMQLGDYGNADKLMNTGIQMDGMRFAQKAASDPLLTGGGAPAGQGGQTAPMAASQSQGGSDPMSAYAHSIGSMESGNNYQALGQKQTSGDRAYGRYQVMGSNVGPWTKEVLGQAMSPEDFLANPQAQDAVFKAKFGQSVQQYGNPMDAASVWFSGKPIDRAGNATDSLGTTVPAYVRRFAAGLGSAPQPGAASAPAAAPTGAAPQTASPGGALPAASIQPATPQSATAPAGATPVNSAAIGPNDDVPDTMYQTALRVVGQAQDRDPSTMTLPQQQAVTRAQELVDQYQRRQNTPPTGVAANGTPTPAPGTAPAPPVQVAENGASDAPVSNVHPYGPNGRQPPQAAPQAPAVAALAPAPAPSARPAAPQIAPAASAAQVNGAPVMSDPTMGGLLKGSWVGNPGGYALALRQKAAAYSANPFTKPTGEIFSKLADQIDQGIGRNNITTPEMKNYEVARGQGFAGTLMDFQVTQAKEKADADNASRLQYDTDPTRIRFGGQLSAAQATGAEQGKAPYDLVKTQPTPGGPSVMVPKTDILSGAASGVSAQPAQFAEQQKAIAANESAMQSQFQARQAAHERIDAMSNLLSTVQTGYGTPAFSDAVAKARAAGFQIPDSVLGNPAAVQQFGKNATANIFSQAKEMGGKVLVSEMDGLKQSNANASMQPEANQAILAQQKGILDHEDAYFNAYNEWKGQNPYAVQNDVAKFDAGWSKANPVGKFVDAAKKNIAPLGVPLPPKDKLVDGQAYMVKGQKAKWSTAQNGFVPVGGN